MAALTGHLVRTLLPLQGTKARQPKDAEKRHVMTLELISMLGLTVLGVVVGLRWLWPGIRS